MPTSPWGGEPLSTSGPWWLRAHPQPEATQRSCLSGPSDGTCLGLEPWHSCEAVTGINQHLHAAPGRMPSTWQESNTCSCHDAGKVTPASLYKRVGPHPQLDGDWVHPEELSPSWTMMLLLCTPHPSFMDAEPLRLQICSVGRRWNRHGREVTALTDCCGREYT